jgi:hypothetical protein
LRLPIVFAFGLLFFGDREWICFETKGMNLFQIPRSLFASSFFAALFLSFLGACASSPSTPEERAAERERREAIAPSRILTYFISTSFPGDAEGAEYAKGKTFILPAALSTPERAYEGRILRLYLESHGLVPAAAGKRPDFHVTVEVKTENPPFGIAMGRLLPFTHEIQITAHDGSSAKKTLWRVKSKGRSEDKGVESALPGMLIATREYWGRSSPGEVRVAFSDKDEALNALKP